MTDEDFDAYLQSAQDELEAKQGVLADAFGIGQHERFVVDYERLTLSFFDGERPCAVAGILPVATHVPAKGSLRWAWANDVFSEPAQRMSRAVMELQAVTGYEMFAQETVACDESMAWEIAALACKCLGKAGVYRIPHAALHSYVLIEHVNRIQS